MSISERTANGILLPTDRDINSDGNGTQATAATATSAATPTLSPDQSSDLLTILTEIRALDATIRVHAMRRDEISDVIDQLRGRREVLQRRAGQMRTERYDGAVLYSCPDGTVWQYLGARGFVQQEAVRLEPGDRWAAVEESLAGLVRAVGELRREREGA
jgi:hypothetical protein